VIRDNFISSGTMTDNIWNIMGDEVSHEDPYDHNIPQSEKRRIQNRLNKRRSRKRLKLKLAAAASCKMEALFTLSSGFMLT
jgi:hypothetical protein